MKESEEKLSLTINNSPLGICTVNRKGEFISTNPAYEKILGYSKKELKHLSFYDITHPDNRSKNRGLFTKMKTRDTSSFNFEKKYIRKNGLEIDVLVNAEAIYNMDGSFKLGLAFIQDVTEKKKITEKININH